MNVGNDHFGFLLRRTGRGSVAEVAIVFRIVVCIYSIVVMSSFCRVVWFRSLACYLERINRIRNRPNGLGMWALRFYNIPTTIYPSITNRISYPIGLVTELSINQTNTFLWFAIPPLWDGGVALRYPRRSGFPTFGCFFRKFAVGWKIRSGFLDLLPKQRKNKFQWAKPFEKDIHPETEYTRKDVYLRIEHDLVLCSDFGKWFCDCLISTPASCKGVGRDEQL